jgi:long-chain fatty acid transport protein
MATFVAAVTPLNAGGFAVAQQGAKASGRGGAFASQADDASLAFYNPAAATWLQGWHVYLGGGLQSQETSFAPASGGSVEMQPSGQSLGSLYLTGSLGDRFAIAFASLRPYGLRTHWFASDPVATSALKTSWDSLELNLSFACKVNDRWSLAVGLAHLRFLVEDFSRAYNIVSLEPFLAGPLPPPPQENITLAGNRVGMNAAVHYREEGGYRLGLSFRSQIIVRMDGRLRWSEVAETPAFIPSARPLDKSGCLPDLNGVPGTIYCPLGSAFTDSKVNSTRGRTIVTRFRNTTFVLPATVQVGFGRDGQGRWDWEGDLLWTKWSKFDSIDIFVEKYAGISSGFATRFTTFDTNLQENWRDTFSLHGGADYHLDDHHTLRFGIAYDPSPIKDRYVRPYQPDADKLGLTGGYGWRGLGGQVAADLFVQLWLYDQREATGGPPLALQGSYQTTAIAAGGAVQFRF